MRGQGRLAAAGLLLGLGACQHSSLILLPDEGGGHGAVAVLEANGKPVDANHPSRPTEGG